MPARSRIGRLLAVLVVVALPVLLALPFHPEARLYGDAVRVAPATLRPLVWIAVEWGGNVAAFAVFTIALSAFVARPAVALAIGCATSVLLEAAQLVIPDRVASLGDVLLNCTGATLGWVAVLLVRSARRAPRLVSAA